jgi:hypothetical protein
MTTPDTDRMVAGRRDDSLRRRQRVLKALNDAQAAGDEISVSAIARRAGVDRTFFYRHRDLLAQLHAAEAQPAHAPGVGPTVSRASLQADLANTGARATRLDARVRQLEKKLSEALGEKAWRESGLGAPDDVEQLKARIITLEQQVVDQRLQLEERAEELDAARSTNRELMTRLNTSRPVR